MPRNLPIDHPAAQEYLSKFNESLLYFYAQDRRVPVKTLQEAVQLAGQFGTVDRIQIDQEGPFTDAISFHARESEFPDDFLPLLGVITII